MVAHHSDRPNPSHRPTGNPSATPPPLDGTLPTAEQPASSPNRESRTIFLKLASQDGAMYTDGHKLATAFGQELFNASRGLKADEKRVLTLRPGTEIVIVSGSHKSESMEAVAVSLKTSGFLPWVDQIKLKNGTVISNLAEAPGLKQPKRVIADEATPSNEQPAGRFSFLKNLLSRKSADN